MKTLATLILLLAACIAAAMAVSVVIVVGLEIIADAWNDYRERQDRP
ncbi:hypothetical protein [Actinobaculum sp. 352]|nr:hypothetical protein [Actinobaculum sp. 352]